MTTLCTPTAAETTPRETALPLMLAAVCTVAAAHGIATITVNYDGYGDEGHIGDVLLQGEADEETLLVPEIEMPDAACSSWSIPYRGDATRVDTTLKDAVDDLALEMLTLKHGGWEDGEGAFGELVIDIAARKAALEHSIRIVETECFSHEWEA